MRPDHITDHHHFKPWKDVRAVLAATKEESTLQVSLGQCSNKGLKASNQDFYGAIVPGASGRSLKGIAAAIADGISSSPVSGRAAETAVGAFLEDYYATPESWSVQTAALRVIEATNAWLHAQNSRTVDGDKNRGLVCTLDALVLKGRDAHLFHVGDSRIYRMNGASLECLTRDHRYVVSGDESYLSRGLGIDHQVDVDYRCVPLKTGDVFLLTSDGVHDHIAPNEVADVIKASTDLDAAAMRVVDAALAGGSADNLTIQIVRIDALPPEGSLDVLFGVQDLPIPRSLKAGEELDGLRIVRQLHASSRSHVYLAVDADSNRIAIKIPSSEMRENKAQMQRFMLEEWIAKRLDNDHVLKAVAASAPRTAVYVAMQYLEGQSLRQWMADHPAPDLHAVRTILGQIASGLRAFHRKDMLHQDIRPDNIMIDADGTVKIIDFGSVLVPGVEEAAPGTAGQMPGTFQYTPPEYLSGDAVSWRSDQYALGVIAYQMLTGKLPYGAAVARVTNRTDQRRLTYTPAREHMAQVPLWVDAALKRAVHPDPLQRFDALSEFMMALSQPSAVKRAQRHVPLADRNPAQFWKAVSGVFALLVIALVIERFGG